MVSTTHTFFEKCLAGMLSALLSVFVVLSCCTPLTPSCCEKAETSTVRFQNAKAAVVGAACCMEQDEHAILPLSSTPKIKFLSALPLHTRAQIYPKQALSSLSSLKQQVFHKDHSKRYLELGVFLS